MTTSVVTLEEVAGLHIWMGLHSILDRVGIHIVVPFIHGRHEVVEGVIAYLTTFLVIITANDDIKDDLALIFNDLQTLIDC